MEKNNAESPPLLLDLDYAQHLSLLVICRDKQRTPGVPKPVDIKTLNRMTGYIKVKLPPFYHESRDKNMPREIVNQCINLCREEPVMSYLIVSEHPFAEEFIRRFITIQKHREHKLCLFPISENFDAENKRSAYARLVSHFQWNIIKCLDSLDYQLFPCTKQFTSTLHSDPLFFEKFTQNPAFIRGCGSEKFPQFWNSWDSVQQFIDFEQLQMQTLNLLQHIESRKWYWEGSCSSSGSVYENINSELRGRIISISSKFSSCMHVYIHHINFTPTSTDLYGAIQQHKSIHENASFIPENQPLVSAVFQHSQIEDGNEPHMLLLASEVTLSQLRPILLDTSEFLCDFLQFHFQFSQSNIQIRNSHSRLGIFPHDDRLDLTPSPSSETDKDRALSCPHHVLRYQLVNQTSSSIFKQLTKAFSHITCTSYLPYLLDSYDPLEYLGDAILSMVASYQIMRMYPHFGAQKLSDLHQHCVCNQNLTVSAKRLLLHFSVWISVLPEKNKVSADVVESVIGALFQVLYSKAHKPINPDHKCPLDLSPVFKFCSQWIVSPLEESFLWQDYVYHDYNLTVSRKFLWVNQILASDKVFSRAIAGIENFLQYSFPDEYRHVLIEALTLKGPSNGEASKFFNELTFRFGSSFNNSRLGFLGANIIKMVVSSFCFQNCKNKTVRDLDIQTHEIMSEKTLPQELVDIVTDEPFCIPQNELTGVLNALIGAIFVSHPHFYRFSDGIDVVNSFILKHIISKGKRDSAGESRGEPFMIQMHSLPDNLQIVPDYVLKYFPRFDLQSVELASTRPPRFACKYYYNTKCLLDTISKRTFSSDEAIKAASYFSFFRVPRSTTELVLVRYYCNSEQKLVQDILRFDSRHSSSGTPREVHRIRQRPCWFFISPISLVDMTRMQRYINMCIVKIIPPSRSRPNLYRWNDEGIALDTFRELMHGNLWNSPNVESPKMMMLRDLLSQFFNSGTLLCEIPLSKDEIACLTAQREKIIRPPVPRLLYVWRAIHHSLCLLSNQVVHQNQVLKKQKRASFSPLFKSFRILERKDFCPDTCTTTQTKEQGEAFDEFLSLYLEYFGFDCEDSTHVQHLLKEKVGYSLQELLQLTEGAHLFDSLEQVRQTQILEIYLKLHNKHDDFSAGYSSPADRLSQIALHEFGVSAFPTLNRRKSIFFDFVQPITYAIQYMNGKESKHSVFDSMISQFKENSTFVLQMWEFCKSMHHLSQYSPSKHVSFPARRERSSSLWRGHLLSESYIKEVDKLCSKLESNRNNGLRFENYGGS